MHGIFHDTYQLPPDSTPILLPFQTLFLTPHALSPLLPTATPMLRRRCRAGAADQPPSHSAAHALPMSAYLPEEPYRCHTYFMHTDS